MSIKSRPELGVLFGDVWHGNKSQRRAREELVLQPGSLGWLRAAQLEETGGCRSNHVGLRGDLKGV